MEKIDALLEKYFEGQTTVQEERVLQHFFQQKNVPEKYKAEQAMFDYFATAKGNQTVRIPLYRKLWVQSVAAAAVVILAFGIFLQIPEGQKLLSGGSYVIKNGVVYSDPSIVHEEALKALDAVSSGKKTEPKSNKIDEAQTIMLEQLSQFGK